MAIRWIVLAAVLLGTAAPQAAAQNPFSPAYTVNDGVITHYDIAQRVRLLEALGARGDLRAIAVEQLTEDRLKVQAGRALGVELPEGAVFAGIEEFAAQRGLAVDDVLQILAARDIDRQTMDDFVEAGLLWREVIQSRFRQRALPTEEELDASLAEGQSVEIVQLSEIALPFAERGEEATLALAERLSRDLSRGGGFAAAAREYSRSSTAARGGAMDPVPAFAMPPAIRAAVLLLPPGGVTRPIPISGGVVILRLDGIREERRPPPTDPVEAEEARNALREQLFGQRLTGFGQGYLQELLRDALIVEQEPLAVAN